MVGARSACVRSIFRAWSEHVCGWLNVSLHCQEKVQGQAGIVGKVDIWLICNWLINTGEVVFLCNIEYNWFGRLDV